MRVHDAQQGDTLIAVGDAEAIAFVAVCERGAWHHPDKAEASAKAGLRRRLRCEKSVLLLRSRLTWRVDML